VRTHGVSRRSSHGLPRIALVAGLLCGLGGSAVGPARAAQEFEKVATVGAQFLKLPIGARGVAMGGAFTAVADDASCVWWNVGALARLQNDMVAVHHTPWFAGINLSQMTYITHVRALPGAVAVHARALYMPEEDVRTVSRPDGEGTTFDAGDISLGLSYARSLTDKFSTGVGMNFVQSTLATYSASAVTFDFGTLYDTGYRNVTIGMQIQNIGSQMTFIEEAVKVPTLFRVGMASRLLDRRGHRMLLAGEFSHPPDNTERANVGMEYSFQSVLYLRGGWYYRFDLERYSAGVGLRIPGGLSRESRVDYAFTEMDGGLPGIHRVSAEFRL